MPRRDWRSYREKLRDSAVAWTYIVGLSTMLIVWSLIAWKEIGAGTMTYPDYHLPSIVPAQAPYQSLENYERPQR